MTNTIKNNAKPPLSPNPLEDLTNCSESDASSPVNSALPSMSVLVNSPVTAQSEKLQLNVESKESGERSDCYSETSSISDATDIQSMIITPLQHQAATEIEMNSETKLNKDGRLQKKRGPKPKSSTRQPNHKKPRLSTSNDSKDKCLAAVAHKQDDLSTINGSKESSLVKVIGTFFTSRPDKFSFLEH